MKKFLTAIIVLGAVMIGVAFYLPVVQFPFAFFGGVMVGSGLVTLGFVIYSEGVE